MKKYLLFILFSSSIQAVEFSGNIGIENRYFLNSALYSGQADNYYGLSLQAEARHRWDNGRKKITFISFYRWDSEDKQRTHGDIRELDIIAAKGDWEIQAGISRVFWGVTESQHLVDIINQTDSVESSDGEEKLGQPLLRLSYFLDNGSLDLYVLPYFRERTFAGQNGRLRSGLVVDTDNPRYEADNEERHIDYALRWNHNFDEIDLGLSWFQGTSRAPSFILNRQADQTVLTPYYAQIRQIGLDLQYTGDAWLWKFEGIQRRSQKSNYTAAVGGFEYTFSGVADSDADLGLLAEYHHDSRGEQASTPFQKDLFLATRLTLNDVQSTAILAGVLFDLETQGRSLRLEASRRLGDSMTLSIEAQWFTHIDSTDSLYAFRADDFIELELKWFF